MRSGYINNTIFHKLL